jgi:hypothetical protein
VKGGAARLAALGLALGVVAPVRAHVVYERATLREWITRSELVVVALFEDGPRVWQAPDGSDRQEFFRVRVDEALHGVAPTGSFEFFPHAEGFPRFRAGDRALLFLEPTRARAEFASLAPRFPWFSVQGAGQEWILAGTDGEAARAIARRWASLRAAGAGDPTGAVRALLVDELGSGVARLRADAVSELVRVHALPGFLDAEGVAALAPFADAPALSLTQRLALVRLLEGRPGFDVRPRLRALAREAEAGSGAELAQMMRVAGASDDPELHAWLAALAGDARPWVRREAAGALRASADAPPHGR